MQELDLVLTYLTVLQVHAMQEAATQLTIILEEVALAIIQYQRQIAPSAFHLCPQATAVEIIQMNSSSQTISGLNV